MSNDTDDSRSDDLPTPPQAPAHSSDGKRETTPKLGPPRASQAKTRSVRATAMTSIRDRLANVIREGRVSRQGLRGALDPNTRMRITLKPFVLSIDAIAPQPLIENRPGRVYFTLSCWATSVNPNAKKVNGYVRARITPRQNLPDYEGMFRWEIDEIGPGDIVSGVISFVAPCADLKNRLTLEFYTVEVLPTGEIPTEVDTLRASAEQDLPVGARFSLSIDDIRIRDTASYHEDTLVINVSGQRDGVSWSDSKSLGDHNNTIGRAGIDPQLAPVGPFDALEGDGSGIVVSYLLANRGYPSDARIALDVLNTISDVGAAVATFVFSSIYGYGGGWAAVSDALNRAHHSINNAAFADCDTVLILDSRNFTTDDLFRFTFDPECNLMYAGPAPLRYQKKAGDKLIDWLGGGCRDSDYSLQLTITRHRPPEMVHTAAEDGVRLGYGQSLSFGMAGPNLAYVKFDLEGDGDLKLDGTYTAPTSPGDNKYAVVSMTVFMNTPNGPQAYYNDFRVILFE